MNSEPLVIKLKGIIFIKINPLFKDIIDVKHLANKIVRDVRENKIPVSRFSSEHLMIINLFCLDFVLNSFQSRLPARLLSAHSRRI